MASLSLPRLIGMKNHGKENGANYWNWKLHPRLLITRPALLVNSVARCEPGFAETNECTWPTFFTLSRKTFVAYSHSGQFFGSLAAILRARETHVQLYFVSPPSPHRPPPPLPCQWKFCISRWIHNDTRLQPRNVRLWRRFRHLKMSISLYDAAVIGFCSD